MHSFSTIFGDKILTCPDQITIREAKRQNAAYRRYSVEALGQVALAREDIDMSKTVFEIVSPLLAEDETEDKEDAMDIDGGQPRQAALV
jgi:proteasome component ECM29